MEGEEEGASAPRNPRHHEGCLSVCEEVWPPQVQGVELPQTAAGGA